MRPGDLVFDIGAHVGNRTRALRAAGARVVAVEPQPLFFRVLARTAGPGVVVRNCAVGAAPGFAELHISSRHPTVSTLAPDWISDVRSSVGFERVTWDASERVEVTTLDALIGEHGLPRFCKIDVEGFEAEVLRGLMQAVPWLAFEYLPAAIDRAIACIELVSRLGVYSFNRVVGEGHSFESDHWLSAADMKAELEGLRTSRSSGDIYAQLAYGHEER